MMGVGMPTEDEALRYPAHIHDTQADISPLKILYLGLAVGLAAFFIHTI